MASRKTKPQGFGPQITKGVTYDEEIGPALDDLERDLNWEVVYEERSVPIAIFANRATGSLRIFAPPDQKPVVDRFIHHWQQEVSAYLRRRR